MILRIYTYENDISFCDEYVNVIQTQNTIQFSKLISDFYKMSQGKNEIVEDKIVLMENDKIINFEKNVMIISDYWNFDFNQKKVQNALFHYIEETMQLEYEKMSRFQKELKEVEMNMRDIFLEIPFELEYKEDISVLEYLKMLGLKVLPDEKLGILENLYLLIDIVAFLNVTKLLVFVNLKRFLSKEQIEEVYKYILYKKVFVLLLEVGEEQECLKREKILFLDSDYDEFILYNKEE